MLSIPYRKGRNMTKETIHTTNVEKRMTDGTNSKIQDSSSKIIFGDPIFCAQFLRGYTEIPLLKNVQPEDIEDVSERYVHMFTEERDSDIVKKVKLKNSEMPFYLISLIEHKSSVEYNVVMQILRYMVYIWEDYEKECEIKQKGISKNKDFKYPPILPIIFYNGSKNWTASLQLNERIYFSDSLAEYIPDYRCMLIPIQKYSNSKIIEKKDELSLLMLINKLSEAADFKKLEKEIPPEYLQDITANTPEYLLNIMVEVIRGLLSKLNLPREEVDVFVEQVKERKMGDFFSNFKGYDVPATRREAREEAYEENYEKVIKILKELCVPLEKIEEQLMEKYSLDENEAKEKLKKYY